MEHTFQYISICIVSIILLVIFLQNKIRENFDWNMSGSVGMGTSLTDITSARGLNIKRSDGYWTHFDWKDDGKNYIRGDTLIQPKLIVSQINQTGTGKELVMWQDGGGWCNIFSKQSATTYGGLNLNFAMYLKGDGDVNNNGRVGIGTADPGFPLHIKGVGARTSTEMGSGRHFNSGGLGNGPYGYADISLCIEGGNIWMSGGVMYATSDKRQKDNICLLSDKLCKDFINKVKVVSFSYKKNPDNKNYGYIAQDLIKTGFGEFVKIMPEKDIEETTDEDGFISPKDHTFVVSKEDIIPILHRNIKILYDENTQLKNQISLLQERMEKMESLIAKIL